MNRRFRRASAFVSALLLSGLLSGERVFAQSAGDEAPLVDRVDIQSNQYLQKETLLFYISTKAGDRYDERRLKDDFRRLWETGFLDDLSLDDFAAELERDPMTESGSVNWEMIDEELKGGIDALSPEYRSVLLLWALGDLSYQEIADVSDCAIGTVMSRLYRARQQLSQKSENQQERAADGRGHADKWMKSKADAEIERHPRKIEQRGRSETGEEAADLIEVAHGLQSIS